MGDTIFIFCLALIIFGPKKLPEIGRQIGKLMVEFRRASNEFKMQIEEELRASEADERQKEISAAPVMTQTASTTTVAALAASASSESAVSSVPVIAPPSTGLPVNHTFPSTEPTVAEATAPVAPDAYPEPENDFNAGLNTASNGAIAEVPAYATGAFHLGEVPQQAAHREIVDSSEVKTPAPEAEAEAEKAQSPHA